MKENDRSAHIPVDILKQSRILHTIVTEIPETIDEITKDVQVVTDQQRLTTLGDSQSAVLDQMHKNVSVNIIQDESRNKIVNLESIYRSKPTQSS